MKKCQWCGTVQETSRVREGLDGLGLTHCDDCVRDESEAIIETARGMSEAMQCMRGEFEL